MKKKLLALTLALLMLCSAIPVGAIGMIGVETAEEISEIILETVEEAVLSAEAVPENAPAWSVFYEDYETKTLGVTANGAKGVTYAADGYADVTIANYQTSGVYTADPVDENNTAYKIVATSMYNAGLRILFPSSISESGSYTLSYRWYVTPSIAENFQHVSTFSRIYFAEAENDGNYFGSTNTASTAKDSWNIQTVTFDISEENGTKYISVDGGEVKELTDDIIKILIHTVSHNSYGWDGSTDADGEFVWYLDDVYLAYYPQTTTVKYVDVAGNELYSETADSMKYELATKAELGTSYYPAYSYNGTTINSNYFNIPGEVNEITITVTENNIIMTEDFESYNNGHAFINSANNEQKVVTPAFVREGRNEKLQSGDCNELDGVKTAQEWYVDTLSDGNQVLHVKGNRAKYNSVGIKFLNLDFTTPGTYVLSYNVRLLRGAGNVWYQCENIPGIGGELAVSTKFSPIVYTWVVTENQDATLSVTVSSNVSGATADATMASDAVGKYCWYPNAENTGASGVCEMYIDDITLSYSKAVTVNFVDENGTTLKSTTANTGSALKLPSSTELGVTYTPAYTIGTETYIGGAYYVVPANATEITFTVGRLAFPATAPNNAVVFEDYQNCSTTTSGAAKIPFTYRADGYDGASVVKYSGTGSYMSAPDDANNMVYKVVGTDRYHNGLRIEGLTISEVGKYTVSYDFYTPDSAEKHPNLSGFGRIYDGSTAHQWGGWSNGDIARSGWNTVTYNWEIYMDGETKMLRYNSWDPAVEFSSATMLELYNECGTVVDTNDIDGDGNVTEKITTATSSNPYTVYYDNVRITWIKPSETVAVFVDANGDSFDYTTTQTNLGGAVVLPTAADMGLGYEPQFTAPDGKIYYSGMTYTPEVAEDKVEFVVEKTNVIYYNDYETTSAGWATPGFAKAPLADAKAFGDRNYTYNGDIASRTNNLASGSHTPEMIKTGITEPGVYKISVDAELEVVKNADTDLVDTGIWANIQLVGIDAVIWSSTGDTVYFNDSETSKTVYGYFEVYEEEGVLYIRKFNHYHSSKLEAAKIDQIRFGAGTSDAFKSSTETKAEHYVYFDNVKIEYFPYEAQNTGLASYRPQDDNQMGGPAGIRFASYINDTQKSIVSEYGYVATRKELITTDGNTNYELLNLGGVDAVSATGTTATTNADGIKIVAAAAYDGVVNKVYSTDGKYFANDDVTFQGSFDTFFTGVLYGITTDQQKEDVFVARPYVKINGVYYYGECHEASYNEVYNKANA